MTIATASDAASMASGAEPRRVGDWRLERRVGAGAMGEVWFARHVVSGGVGAVKVWREGRYARERLRRFFGRERRAIARLSHPHIVALYDVGPDYLVTAYIDGADLARRLRTPLDPARALEIIRQIADALVHAHAEGVVHRDVKPSNILLDAQGNAFLADFGLASLLDDADSIGPEDRGGTPAFMAPEQARGERVGPAADQYALARTLLVMLAGGTVPAEPEAALAELPSSLPAALVSALRRATELEPERRFPGIDAFAAALAAPELAELGDLRAHPAPHRLAPETRVRTPFAWLAGAHRVTAPAPDVVRADYRLSALAAAGALPPADCAAFLENAGYADFGWAVYGRPSRLGPLTEASALARASDVVVLLHGLFFDREVWHSIALAVCRDNAQAVVVVPDLHGAGESQFAAAVPSAAHAGPGGLVRAVLGFLGLLRVRALPSVLVGHSLTATALIEIGDDEVGALTQRIALTPVLPAFHPTYRRYLIRTARLTAVLGGVGFLRRTIGRRMVARAPQFKALTDACRQRIQRGFLAMPSPVLARLSRAFADARPADGARLRRCLLVFGVGDPLVPLDIVDRAVADLRIAPGNVVRAASGGHYPLVEDAEHPEWTARNTNEIIHMIDAMLVSSREGTLQSTQVASTLPGSTTE